MQNKRPECIHFGEIVRALRLKKGLSQEYLAEIAEVHRTYMGGIERGERNPTLTMICRLAKALNVSASRLLRGVGKVLKSSPAENNS